MTHSVSESQRFARVTSLAPAGIQMHVKGELPGESANRGDRVSATLLADDGQVRKQISLSTKLAEGGEGAVFTTNVKGYVAKIYHRDKITTDRLAKLQTMISKPVRHPGICFPEAILLNSSDEFVGYLMPQAKGEELSKSVFIPMLLPKKFPRWTRKDTIQLCLTILEKIRFLNDRRVILGDINAANILVVSPREIYFVDCDSYQIEGYPCTVGTANFTPPEVSGRDFKTFLRTQEMENFAIATLLFMIMLPGKPPYSAVGGSSPAENIKAGLFPYEGKDDSVPPGKWGFIWNHMTYRVREAFADTFKRGGAHFSPTRRYSTAEWSNLFTGYLSSADKMLKNDPMAMDIFPTRRKMKRCKQEGCTNRFVPTEENFYIFCDEHLRRPRRSTTVSTRQYATSGVSRTAHTSTSTKLQCKNPTCGKSFIPTRGPRAEYCDACWRDVGCKQCGYIAAKWMHDERGGYCRRHAHLAKSRLATNQPSAARGANKQSTKTSPAWGAILGWSVAIVAAIIIISALASASG